MTLSLAMDLNIFCSILQDPQPDTGQGSDSGGEGGEDSVQDKEAEREKYIQKRKYVTCNIIDLTLFDPERPKLHRVSALLSAIGLIKNHELL